MTTAADLLRTLANTLGDLKIDMDGLVEKMTNTGRTVDDLRRAVLTFAERLDVIETRVAKIEQYLHFDERVTEDELPNPPSIPPPPVVPEEPIKASQAQVEVERAPE